MANTTSVKRVKKKDEPVNLRKETQEARQLRTVKKQQELNKASYQDLYSMEARKGNTPGTSLSKGAMQAARIAGKEAEKEFKADPKNTFKKDYVDALDKYVDAAKAKAAREYAAEERRETRGYNKGGDVKSKAFKPCAGCPTPAKCKAAGKCLMKEGKAKTAKKGAPKGPTVMIAIVMPKKGKK